MSPATTSRGPTGTVATALAPDDEGIARTTMRRVSLRLLPFLFALYIFNYLDRTNLGIAKLQMGRDLGWLSESAYGLGAGIFFVGYALFEVPSNLVLARVGARRWIARIMISWGLVASAMMLVRTPGQFYGLRFLLGVAEAGFFPGIIYYLSQWFPAPERARAVSRFIIAIPLSSALGSPLSGSLLGLDGALGLRGWQWLFLLEGIPSVLLGLAVLAYLTDRPDDTRWLPAEQRAWLVARLARDQAESAAPHGLPPLRALAHPLIWLLALPLFLLVTTNYAYTFWAPTVIRDALHASNLETGLILGAIASLAAVGMLLVGASSDRSRERPLHVAACAALIAFGYLGAALFPSAPARVATLALAYVGAMAYLAPFWCLPSMLLRGSAAAAGIALVNSVGNLGGFAGPAAVGWLKNATGSTAGAFLGLAGLALVAAAMMLAVRRQAAFSPRGRAGAAALAGLEGVDAKTAGPNADFGPR